MITTWAADEATKLKVYESIEDINWRTDEFVFTSPHNETHPDIAALFINHGRKLTLHRTDLYYIDRKAALDIELRLRISSQFRLIQLNLRTVTLSGHPMIFTSRA